MMNFGVREPESNVGSLNESIFVGDMSVGGTLDATAFQGEGTLLYFGGVWLQEQSSDPASPIEGSSVIWQSDGTGSGDDGDIMMKITAGGTTKTATLVDFSGV